jgi:protein-L-isoaspartate(D-aspartate) O-methyltransferase
MASRLGTKTTAPDARNSVIAPAPDARNSMIAPAPDARNSMIAPAPDARNSMIAPAPDARNSMIDSQLRPSGVNDPDVIAAFARVERADFVPAEARDFAYMDRPINLGAGRFINPPFALARLIVAAGTVQGKNMLLIGAAGGYGAAILAELGAQIVAVETDAKIAGAAATVDGVTLVLGALEAGAVAHAPFDIILIDGAISQLPHELAAQLKHGGRIVTGVSDGVHTQLARGIKTGADVALVPFADMECVILPGFDRPSNFQF